MEELTLRLSPEARETIEWIAAQRGGKSAAEVIRHALGTQRYVMEVVRKADTC